MTSKETTPCKSQSLGEEPGPNSPCKSGDGGQSYTTDRWPAPTPEMLASPKFEAIWQCIRWWDVGVPSVYEGYCGATGNHVRAILDALARCS
jgi:hypothetical protein